MAIVTMTQALKKLYKAVVGEDTTKNNPTKIVSELADNWSGGGGGGSSDFSTAEVTVIVNSSAGEVNIAMPILVEADGDYPASLYSYAPYSGEMTVNSALYKGRCTASVILSETQTISTSGSATVSGVYVDITGNCTITISDK